MSIKLLCVVCQKGSHEFSLVHFMDADGFGHPGQYMCDNCRGGRPLICKQHNEPHVVFIDGSSACPTCVREISTADYLVSGKIWKRMYNMLGKFVPQGDRAGFLRIMRNATDHHALVGECLVRAVVAFCLRNQISLLTAVRFTRIEVSRRKSFFVILPSAKPQKPLILKS